MKKLFAITRIAYIGTLTIGLSACSTGNYKSSLDWQDKVWRGRVVKPMLNTSGKKYDTDFIAATKFVSPRDDGIRISRVQFASGWNSTIAVAVVPDNLEFSQLESGTIVDIMAELGPNIDFGTQRFTRILGIVCAKSDETCIKHEKDANRINSVIDAHPPNDISAKYGATYNRRLTPEEIKKYD